jgi:endonuclease G, mitochondrial
MNRTFVVLPACVLLFSGCLLAEEGDGSLSSDNEQTAAEALPLESLAATRDNNMALGNPSNATTATSNANNFLINRPQYALSYNNSRGSANWVSWHLSTAWKGSAPRSTTFTADTTLPTGFVKAFTSWYTNTGFDRGHLCPSDDRDASTADNQATFILTNIVPQSPINNQQTWRFLEDYARTLITAGNELYIVAGPGGTGGTGSVGAADSIHSGDVTVPDFLWKVIVVLPVGSNDVTRVTTSTRVIAVKMPNDQTVNAHPWDFYRVSVDSIESLTGFNFLSSVSTSVQSVIEASVDNGPVN